MKVGDRVIITTLHGFGFIPVKETGTITCIYANDMCKVRIPLKYGAYKVVRGYLKDCKLVNEVYKMNKYCVAITRDGSLVNDSAEYFANSCDMDVYCRETALKDNEEFYVTLLHNDEWCYSSNVSFIMNIKYNA